jgi:Uma2 family endonuclease
MVETRLVTADDLLAMGSDARYELIDGELHEVSPTSFESGLIASYLYGSLLGYVRPRRLGLVVTAEAGWVLRQNPDTVVAPDIGFVRAERLPSQPDWDRFILVVPDLAVEVVSPSDRPGDLLRKVQVYADAGVPLVWVVYPKRRAVTVYRLSEPPVTLQAGDTLTGADVLPGFEMAVAEIFADPLA